MRSLLPIGSLSQGLFTFPYESGGEGAPAAQTQGSSKEQVDFDIIVDAIFQVNEGLHYLDKNVSEAVITTLRTKPNSVRRSELSLLNEKEIEVIRLVCNGLKNQEIAAHLCLSSRTIEGIRLQISKKTKTNKVVDLIYFALKNRIHTIQ
jgi:DNA-binding NarL/FixJ family response regulator